MSATGYSGTAVRLNGVNQVIEAETALSGNVNYIVLEFRPASTSEPIFQFDAGEDLTLNGASAITTNGLGTVTSTFQKGSTYEANKWVRVRYDFSSPVAITDFTAGLVGAAYGEVDFSYIECDLFTLELFDGGGLGSSGKIYLLDSKNFNARYFTNGTWVENLSGKENGETHNGISQFKDHNCKKYFASIDDERSTAPKQTLGVGDYFEMAGPAGNGYRLRVSDYDADGNNFLRAISINFLRVEIASTLYIIDSTNGVPNNGMVVGYNVVRLTRVDASNYELDVNGTVHNIANSNAFEWTTIHRQGNNITNEIHLYDYIDANGTIANYSTKMINVFSENWLRNSSWVNVPEDIDNPGFDIFGQALHQKITDGSNDQQYWQYLPFQDRIAIVSSTPTYQLIDGQYIDYGKAFSHSEFTLMFVVSGDFLATETSKILFDARDADNDGIRVWLNASGYPELQYNTQDLNKGSVVSNGAQLWTVIADATDLYFRIDGVQVATATKTGGTIATTVNAILGAESFGTKTNFWTGLIAEFFPVQAALSGTTLTDKENELMTKYGI